MCGKVRRIELRTLCIQSRRGPPLLLPEQVPPPPVLHTPIMAAVFQEKADTVTESAHTAGIAQAAPQDKPAAFGACPGAWALAWPGSRYPPCTVAPHSSLVPPCGPNITSCSTQLLSSSRCQPCYLWQAEVSTLDLNTGPCFLAVPSWASPSTSLRHSCPVGEMLATAQCYGKYLKCPGWSRA